MVLGSHIGSGKILFSASHRPDPALLPTSRVKRPGRDVDHSLPSSCEVKWRYTAVAPVCLPGVDRENSILTFPLVLHVTPRGLLISVLCVVNSILLCVVYSIMLCVVYSIVLCVGYSIVLCVIYSIVLCVVYSIAP